VKTTIKLFAVFALAVSAHASYSAYFPQIADGGSSAQEWITTMTFFNPTTTAQVITINLYGDNGAPLALDFGDGPTSVLVAALAPAGSVTYKSTGANTSTVTGWAIANSSMLINGVVMYEYLTNGVPQQGVTVGEIGPSTTFMSPATSSTGVAVANPNPYNQIEIEVMAVDQDGVVVEYTTGTLNSGQHVSLSLTQLFPSLPSGFRGSIIAASIIPGTTTISTFEFVGMSLSGDGGVLSSYPMIAAPELNNVSIPNLRKPAVQP
jgi:hypothetical protein